VTWDEVERAASTGDSHTLKFEAADVLTRVDAMGDLFAPMVELEQQLPTL
jgi:bifunctional non-homologous end joining protein LigD